MIQISFVHEHPTQVIEMKSWLEENAEYIDYIYTDHLYPREPDGWGRDLLGALVDDETGLAFRLKFGL